MTENPTRDARSLLDSPSQAALALAERIAVMLRQSDAERDEKLAALAIAKRLVPLGERIIGLDA